MAMEDMEGVDDVEDDGQPSDDAQMRDHGIWQTVVDAFGDQKQPVQVAFFEMAYKKLLGIPDDSEMPGMVNQTNSKPVRQKQIESIFQDEEGWDNCYMGGAT